MLKLLFRLIAFTKALEIPPKVIYNESYVTPFEIPSGSLPSDFLYGYASAAAQVEGAVGVDGRSESIWDVFARGKDKVNDLFCYMYNECKFNMYHLYSIHSIKC